MAGKRTEADEASNRERQNMYSTTYIKPSNMWRKRNDVYLKRLSATNAHKNEDFRSARRRLRNDGYNYGAPKCHDRGLGTLSRVVRFINIHNIFLLFEQINFNNKFYILITINFKQKELQIQKNSSLQVIFRKIIEHRHSMLTIDKGIS